MVNGHLEDSLRREIESYLESRLGAVKQEITTLQSLLNESLSTFLERQGDVHAAAGQRMADEVNRGLPPVAHVEQCLHAPRRTRDHDRIGVEAVLGEQTQVLGSP